MMSLSLLASLPCPLIPSSSQLVPLLHVCVSEPVSSLVLLTGEWERLVRLGTLPVATSLNNMSPSHQQPLTVYSFAERVGPHEAPPPSRMDCCLAQPCVGYHHCCELMGVIYHICHAQKRVFLRIPSQGLAFTSFCAPRWRRWCKYHI